MPKPKPILVVDDDEGFRETLRVVLEREGYEVVCASDGQSALNLILIDGLVFKMIFLDLYMPLKDGWQFAYAVTKYGSKFQRKIPIVITSGKADLSEQETKKSFAGLLRKPFKIEKLIATCKQFESLD